MLVNQPATLYIGEMSVHKSNVSIDTASDFYKNRQNVIEVQFQDLQTGKQCLSFVKMKLTNLIVIVSILLSESL